MIDLVIGDGLARGRFFGRLVRLCGSLILLINSLSLLVVGLTGILRGVSHRCTMIEGDKVS